MAYPDHCHWLRESDIRIRATERSVRRLPHTDNRRRALEHIEAVKRALDDLDRELLETDEIALKQALQSVAPKEDTAYGYAFSDWLAAAGRSDSSSEYDLRAAWRAGESPEEYKLRVESES